MDFTAFLFFFSIVILVKPANKVVVSTFAYFHISFLSQKNECFILKSTVTIVILYSHFLYFCLKDGLSSQFNEVLS